MASIFAGSFLLLHGAIHLLFAGQAWQLFELRPGLKWPDDTWLLRRFPGRRTVQVLAAASMLLAALAFSAAGVGTIFLQGWSQAATSGAAVYSALLFLVFWNGRLKELDAQGAVGVAIDVFLLAAVWVLG